MLCTGSNYNIHLTSYIQLAERTHSSLSLSLSGPINLKCANISYYFILALSTWKALERAKYKYIYRWHLERKNSALISVLSCIYRRKSRHSEADKKVRYIVIKRSISRDWLLTDRSRARISKDSPARKLIDYRQPTEKAAALTHCIRDRKEIFQVTINHNYCYYIRGPEKLSAVRFYIDMCVWCLEKTWPIRGLAGCS